MITMNADEDAHIGTAEYNKGLQHTGITTETEKLNFLEDCNCDYYKEYRDFLECFREFGGNPCTTMEQILKRKKATEK